MSAEGALKSALFISILGHCLFLGIDLRNIPIVKDRIIPEEVFINLEIEEPQALLPKIETLADEKRFKKEESRQSVQDAFLPEERPLETIAEVSPRELFSQQQPEEISESEILRPGSQVIRPAEVESLRYQDMVKQRIEEHLIYPAWARHQAIEGVAVVCFIVLASGQAQEIRLIRSSGSRLLDQETLDTIKRASPFPPIPEGIGAYSIPIDVALVFTLGKARQQ